MGTSINLSCTAYKKTGPRGAIFVFFLQDTLKTAFLNENLNHKRTGHFFSKSVHFFYKIREHFFHFQKRAGETSPPHPPPPPPPPHSPRPSPPPLRSPSLVTRQDFCKTLTSDSMYLFAFHFFAIKTYTTPPFSKRWLKKSLKKSGRTL